MDAWDGKLCPSSDPDFEQFFSIEYGLRAAIKTLQTYQRKHGCRTLRDIIFRWAPPTENSTDAYLRFVSQRTSIEAYDEVNSENREQVCNILHAMTIMECGREIEIEKFHKAWNML